MNNVTEVIKHLRAAQPHMKAMGDALERYALPDVPQIDRLDALVGIAEFIETAYLLECKHIVNMLIERVSDLTGCAPELEDAACSLTRSIEAEARDD